MVVPGKGSPLPASLNYTGETKNAQIAAPRHKILREPGAGGSQVGGTISHMGTTGSHMGASSSQMGWICFHMGASGSQMGVKFSQMGAGGSHLGRTGSLMGAAGSRFSPKTSEFACPRMGVQNSEVFFMRLGV